MKKLIVIFALSLFASAASAEGLLQKDLNKNSIQGAAPDGGLSQLITVDTTIDMSKGLWWGFYAPTACKYRLMKSSAKGSYPQFTVAAGERISGFVNRNTPFLNISGSSDGELSRQ